MVFQGTKEATATGKKDIHAWVTRPRAVSASATLYSAARVLQACTSQAMPSSFSLCFITILALLLIQSQVAHCIFYCNDNSQLPKGATVIGVCARKVNLSEDNQINKQTPIEKWDKVSDKDKYKILYPADSKKLTADHFTCHNVKVATKPTAARYCCDIKFDGNKPQPIVYTQKDLQTHCYSRDGHYTKHKPPPNTADK
ncbi:hypothetical protein PCANC_28646 [Puccinia coronata f. sp. avenae]|uniref:Uncharacterized protein n=1 Tax=Puccinia coronata f. sp. avenae TaxID=200324 RepID=A0A2N5S0I7_9BASI|nr:hypothetical protein PCANC_28646 [Puccinia coronata f. sp. avenae]